ncbi:MAG: hypothetical protein ACFFCM_06740 [Promethearchaeota archaeon]
MKKMKQITIAKDDPDENFKIITDFIRSFLSESSRANMRTKSGKKFPLMRDVIFGVANATDPIFEKYKQVVHPEHWTPLEACQKKAAEEDWNSELNIKSVLVYVLLHSKEVIKSNLEDKAIPSEAWILAKYHHELIFEELGIELSKILKNQGYFTCNPIYVKGYQIKKFKQSWNPTAKRIYASQFSVRHAAFAAGLGTFSLNEGFISDAGGIAHRIGVIVTELELPVTKRNHTDHQENCLWYRSDGKKCGDCISKCPVNALKAEKFGHNKDTCGLYVFGEMAPYSREHYGIPQYGCGKCQVGLPCTYKVPPD